MKVLGLQMSQVEKSKAPCIMGNMYIYVVGGFLWVVYYKCPLDDIIK